MEEYQKEYVRSLASKVEALNAAREALEAGDIDALSSIKRIAHTLRGSGATLGFPNISKLSELVEEAEVDRVVPLLDKLINYLEFLRQEKGEQPIILVVDDSEEIQFILKTTLENKGFQVLASYTAKDAFSLLQEHLVSLIVLDLVLPDTDGRNFLVDLKNRAETTDIPIVVISAKTSSQIKAECYALGASNYFEKPLDVNVLVTQIAAMIQSSEGPKASAWEDPATGLLNRAAIIDAARVMGKSEKKNLEHTLVLLTPNELENLRASKGRHQAENALKKFSQIIKKHFGTNDIIARWHGDEIVILSKQADLNSTRSKLSGLENTLRNEIYKCADGSLEISLNFSAGLVRFELSEEFEQNVLRASALMYAAKNNGAAQILSEEDSVEVPPTRILLAEDDVLTAEFIAHRMEAAGYELTHMVEGPQAYSELRKKKYDLIISDVKMPGMDDFELLRRTRENSANQGTPIIMLTSMGQENDIARGLKIGANDYMLKPFSPTELLARIQRLLR